MYSKHLLDLIEFYDLFVISFLMISDFLCRHILEPFDKWKWDSETTLETFLPTVNFSEGLVNNVNKVSYTKPSEYWIWRVRQSLVTDSDTVISWKYGTCLYLLV